MSKKNRERRTGEGAGVESNGGGSGIHWLPMVIGVAALVLAFVAWTDAKKVKDDTVKQIVDIETKMSSMQTMMANLAKAKPAPQQGPDPNKVYTIKTEGAPTEGNPTAPIVIAEFSDYQ